MLCERELRRDEGLKNVKFDIAAIDDNFVSPSVKCDIYDYAGLSAEKLVEKIDNM